MYMDSWSANIQLALLCEINKIIVNKAFLVVYKSYQYLFYNICPFLYEERWIRLIVYG